MPSLHITWALLIFLYTRGFDGGARVYAALFVFLVACATLGLGEHYLMDLIVASPLVLLVRALCAAGLSRDNAERRRAGAAGLAMLTFWITTIRAGLVLAPPFVIGAAVLTVAASFWLERALARAEERANATAVAPGEKRAGVRADAAPFGAVPSAQ
jgi:predicted neutral ceramidase superfamily lipid hydrolase